MPGFTRPVGAARHVGVPKRRCVGFSLAHCWVILDLEHKSLSSFTSPSATLRRSKQNHPLKWGAPRVCI